MIFGGSISWHLLYTISCRQFMSTSVQQSMFVVAGFFFSIILSCFTPSYFIFYGILSPYREIEMCMRTYVCMMRICYKYFAHIWLYVYVIVHQQHWK